MWSQADLLFCIRLTKIEVQAQEKSDSIKSELREVSQRVRQLDWLNSKMEATLEAIKTDTNGLKHGQDQIRGLHAGSGEWLTEKCIHDDQGERFFPSTQL
jgi:septal ring factor EnvC (AmiA/AmiB activator)